MEVTTADSAYQTIVDALNEVDWKFERFDDDKVVSFGMNGDDLPMSMLIRVNEGLQCITMVSYLPLTFPDDKRIDGAIATVAVNEGTPEGYYFDYVLEKGEIRYVNSISYRGGVLGKEAIIFMVHVAGELIDKYNDKFFMLSKGMINISQFLESLNEQ